METALVIGASKGIGKACALKLAESNPNLRVLAVSRSIKSSETNQEFLSKGITTVDADMSKLEDIQRLTETLEGKVKYLVYCAGVLGACGLENVTSEDFDTTMNINARGAFFLCRDLRSKYSEGARVLFISTLCAHEYCLNFPMYSISKAALYMLYKVLNKDIPEVAFGAVSIGLVKTDMFETTQVSDPSAKVTLPEEVLTPETASDFIYFLVNETTPEEYREKEWDIYESNHHSRWVKQGQKNPKLPFAS